MARKTAAHEKAQKKAAKQKKILLVLAVPMLAALYFGVTTFMNLGKHPAPEVLGKPTSTTAAASSTPASTPDTTAAPVTPDTADAPLTPGVAAVPIVAFRSFTALDQKNPFHDHGPNLNAAQQASSGNGNTDTKSTPDKGKKGDGNGGGSAPKPPLPPLTGAVISLNGQKLPVALGSTFGQAPGLSGVPLFRLVKVTRKTALIGVVGTKQQFTLHVGRPLTLQQYGGWTYTLILEPLGSAAPMTAVQPTGGN
jgi:hypothetical protein